jgi:hypothetical protein
MESIFTDFLAILCAAAGWHYLFHSKAAVRLASLESAPINARRIALRRLCGAVLILLGAAIFIATVAQNRAGPATFLACWLAVIVLLILLVALAWADLRGTAKLRQKLRQKLSGGGSS